MEYLKAKGRRGARGPHCGQHWTVQYSFNVIKFNIVKFIHGDLEILLLD